MTIPADRPVLAFAGDRLIALGPLGEVLAAIHVASGAGEALLVFDAADGRVMDLDLRGEAADALLYGRLIRGADGHVLRIVEAKDCTPEQTAVKACYAGMLAADRAVQAFGGRGWSTLYRPGRHLMDVRVCRIYEGTDEILKLKIAAAVLGKEYEAFK